MATNGPKLFFALLSSFFILQLAVCAPGVVSKSKKNCDLPVLLSQLRNEVQKDQRQPSTYAPSIQQQHILNDISDILGQQHRGDDGGKFIYSPDIDPGMIMRTDETYTPQPHYPYTSGFQGDITASNLGSGVNNVKDSQINVAKNGYGGSGDMIASNSGSGVNNVEGSSINVMKGPGGGYSGDTIASNTGSGVNNVKDSQINVAKEGYGGAGDMIASNSGSGVNNVEGSSINVMKGPSSGGYFGGYSGGHDAYYGQGDTIASNLGSGVNNVKDSQINVAKNGYGGAGDMIASNSGSGLNNVEGSTINVMKGPSSDNDRYYGQEISRGYSGGYPAYSQGDIIASNTGSGVNNVKDSQINVAKEGYGGAGDMIASNSGSGVNNVEGSSINVMKGPSSGGYSGYGGGYPAYSQGDMIASNTGSGVNNVKDSQINVAKEGYGGPGDMIASNSGSGVNNVEGSSINVMKGPSGGGYYGGYSGGYSGQSQGDTIASNTGSGVNSVRDSEINVVKNGYGGGGDMIASNSGSGVNNVEGSSINVMKQAPQYMTTTYAPQYSRRPSYSQPQMIGSNSGSGTNNVESSTVNVMNGYQQHRSTTYAPYMRDVIASNTGSGVNNVKDSEINVMKEGNSGGSFIASNSGSGTNNVQGSKINVMGGGAYTAHPVTFYEELGTANVNGHRIPVVKQEHGDIIGSNTGSGVNNVKDSSILVVKDGNSGGDMIASNSGSGINNVEGSSINVMKGQQHASSPSSSSQMSDNQILAHYVSTHKPEAPYYGGDVIASNFGSGVNNVKDSNIMVSKEGSSGGDFIASNAGSGINNVEGSNINVFKNAGTARPLYIEPVTVYENIGSINFAGHNIPVMIQEQGDIVASNLGSGVNNVKDSEINVVKNGYGGGRGDMIASNSGSGINSVEGSTINVMKQYQGGNYVPTQSERPNKKGSINVIPNKFGTARGDVIGSNTGSGVNNVADSDILVVKDERGGNTIASNTGSGTNNVQGSKINVMGGGSYTARPITIYENMGTANVNGHRIPVVKQEHGDIIGSNTGSGINNVKDSSINVMKNGGGGGDFIASNSGSGVNNVENSQINVMKNQGYMRAPTPFQNYVAKNTGSMPVYQPRGDTIGSNTGSGVNSVQDSEIIVVNDGPSGGNTIASNTGSGTNSVQNSKISVMGGAITEPHYFLPPQQQEDEEEACEDLQDGDMFNVKDILKTLLFGQTSNTKTSLDKIASILSKVDNLQRLRNILKQIFPNIAWNMSDHSLKEEILRVLANPQNTDFSNFINGLYDYKLGGNGGFNALFYLLGYTNAEASRQFNLNVVLNTILQRPVTTESPSHTNLLNSGNTNIYNQANSHGHLNALQSGSTQVLNEKSRNGHLNGVQSGSTDIINQKSRNGHLNTVQSGSTEILNQKNRNGHLNAFQSGSTEILNQKNRNGHLNAFQSGSTEILNQKTRNGHVNALQNEDTSIFNQMHPNGHFNSLESGSTEILNRHSLKNEDASLFQKHHPNGHFNTQSVDNPACELFNFLKTKYPRLNDKDIERAVLNTVANYLTGA